MKIRLRGNSLRLRLTRSEVDAIGRGETVREVTIFPNERALTTLLTPCGGNSVATEFRGDELRVSAPTDALRTWADGDEVGLDCIVEPADFTVTVEKDFSCLTPRAGGDDDDTFPHPDAGSNRC
ncbi:MAG: hypothetical protein AAGC71_16330 [Pseudomonadota bacterium]